MSEVQHSSEPMPKWRRTRQVLGLGAAGLAVGLPVGLYHFSHTEIRTEIAATSVTIEPNFSGDLEIEPGAMLPNAKIPLDIHAGPVRTPIGMYVDVGQSTIPAEAMVSDNLDQIVATVAAVAASPDGEIARIEYLIRQEAKESALLGAGASLLTATLIGLRRKELLERPGGIGLAALAVASAATILMPDNPVQVAQPDWIPITDISPAASRIPPLKNVLVTDNAVTGGVRSLIDGVASTYQRSLLSYNQLEAQVRENSDELYKPTEDQQALFIFSDRHDNIGMDPVLKETANQIGADMVATLGDDTSSGDEWEAFSLRSITDAFQETTRIAVGGNHDNGDFVIDYLKRRGFITADGGVQNVNGVTMLLANDPRKSDYTPQRLEGEKTFAEVEQEIADIACSSDDDVSLILVHDANMGRTALEQGCADLVVGGHTHVYSAPERIEAEDGSVGYTVTNGTSGGAAFSFSLGTKLRRDATALSVILEDGRPVGIQPIVYRTTGEVEPGSYIAIYPERSQADEPESAKKNEPIG